MPPTVTSWRAGSSWMLPAAQDARALGVPRHPAQHRLHPEHQLADAERLDHVVVRAQLQALDAVRLLSLGGDHHHRRPAEVRVLLDEPEHLAARQVGEHQVQQDQVGLERLGPAEGCGPAVAGLGLEARRRQVVGEEVGEVLLVLDNQDARHDGGTSGEGNFDPGPRLYQTGATGRVTLGCRGHDAPGNVPALTGDGVCH